MPLDIKKLIQNVKRRLNCGFWSEDEIYINSLSIDLDDQSQVIPAKLGLRNAFGTRFDIRSCCVLGRGAEPTRYQMEMVPKPEASRAYRAQRAWLGAGV